MYGEFTTVYVCDTIFTKSMIPITLFTPQVKPPTLL